MKVSLSLEALTDAQQVADWYIDQYAGPAALALSAEIDSALEKLCRSPGLGTPGPEGTRIWPIHRFPVSLVYRVQGDELRVIAVASQRKRPGYWRGRR
jgi:toxin ParE1/3/4